MENTNSRLALEFLERWNDRSDTILAHTSGSTGVPKTIFLKKSDMAASARSTNHFFNIKSGDILYCPLSVEYIAGMMMVVRGIISGAKVIFENPSNRILENHTGRRIKLIAVVPSQLPNLMNSEKITHIENIIVGGAPLSPTLESELSEIGTSIYATYGMTETCSHVALRRVGEKIYHALPGYSFTEDNRNCLVIDTSIQSFGRLTTNDVIRLIDNQQFEWVGRYDNVINSGGIKIHPEELESAILKVLPNEKFYIVGRKHDIWGDEAVLVIEYTNKQFIKEQIFEQIFNCHPHARYIKDILMLNRFQYTSSGKIKRILPE